MGFIRVYSINYYFHDGLKSWDDLEDVRNQCIYASIDEKRDVMLHKHAHSDKACEFKPEQHELYRAGALIGLED